MIKRRLRLPFGLNARKAALVPVLTMLLMGVGVSAAEARRLALVVGNSAYDKVAALRNASRDAREVAEALKRLGFEVTLLTDVQSKDFWDQVDTFSQSAEGAESTVFFYSGHAFQMNGANYLIPVDATLSSREKIQKETWNLDGIIARLQDRNRQTLIFLDACRNDPLPQTVRGSAAADGLARLQTGVGTFVAFATEPGAVAYDGAGEAPNSPFTTALLENIETPGISVSDMMIRVRNEVGERTLRHQTPWDQSSLREQFYFNPEMEAKQELSEADYELLAQFPPEDRKKFLDLLRASGFSEDSLRTAEVAIEVAGLNLEIAASDGGVSIGSFDPEQPDHTPQVTLSQAEETDTTPQQPEAMAIPLETVDGGVTITDVPMAIASIRPRARVSLPEMAATPAAVASPDGTVAATASDTAPTAGTAETITIAAAEATAPAPPIAAATSPITATETIARIEETNTALLPQLASANPEGAPPIRLAALDAQTRGLIAINALTVDRLRLSADEVIPDNEASRALLARINPRLLNPQDGATDPTMGTREMAISVQTELRRLGCYLMRIDGDWGRGSRTALTSYFLAKRQVPESLEPTSDLLAQLKAETKVVCAVRVAKAVVKGKTRAILPAAKAATETRRVNQSTGRVIVTQTERRTNIRRGLLNPGSF